MVRGDGRQWIEVLDPDNLPEDLQRDIAHLRRDRNYSRLIDSVIGQVSRIAPDSRHDTLVLGFDLVEQLMIAANRTAWESAPLERARDASAAPYVYWHHVDVSALGAEHLMPSVRLDDAQDIAATYLRLPFRVTELDRQILDMMLAAHIREFAAANAPFLADTSRGLSPLWTKNMIPVVLLGVLWGGLWLAPIARPLAIICGLASLGLAALALRSGLSTADQARRRARHALEAMQRAYAILATNGGDLSVARDHIRLARAEDKTGLAGLNALIDDILTRQPKA